MSASIMVVDYKIIGGGSEFAEWLEENFTSPNDDKYLYITPEEWNEKVKLLSKDFLDSHREVMRTIKKRLDKELEITLWIGW